MTNEPMKQIATYPDGKVITRNYTGHHGLKLNGQRPIKVELWGACDAHVKGCKYAVHPINGELIVHD